MPHDGLAYLLLFGLVALIGWPLVLLGDKVTGNRSDARMEATYTIVALGLLALLFLG